jgi:hypothetical protein
MKGMLERKLVRHRMPAVEWPHIGQNIGQKLNDERPSSRLIRDHLSVFVDLVGQNDVTSRSARFMENLLKGTERCWPPAV